MPDSFQLPLVMVAKAEKEPQLEGRSFSEAVRAAIRVGG